MTLLFVDTFRLDYAALRCTAVLRAGLRAVLRAVLRGVARCKAGRQAGRQANKQANKIHTTRVLQLRLRGLQRRRTRGYSVTSHVDRYHTTPRTQAGSVDNTRGPRRAQPPHTHTQRSVAQRSARNPPAVTPNTAAARRRSVRRHHPFVRSFVRSFACVLLSSGVVWPVRGACVPRRVVHSDDTYVLCVGRTHAKDATLVLLTYLTA